MVHLPRLQEVPLGPRNAFIKCAMATFDCPSDLVHRIAYPSLGRPGLRTDSRRLPALPAEEEERSSASASLQGVEAGDIFRESLIASGKSRRRNPWAAAGALAIQLLLLLALIVIPLFHTEPLPKREMVTMLYAPPLGGAAPNITKFQAPTPAYTSKSVPAPAHGTQEVPPAPISPTGGVIGGVPGGVVGGVSSGVFSEVSSTHSLPVLAKTPEPPAKRIRVAARVVEANLIHDVAPTYPPEAGRARIEGAVVLLAVIAKDGSVQDVRVESGLPLLAQAAIDAVKQWRYRPYLVNGEPVEVDSRITINFTLSGA